MNDPTVPFDFTGAEPDKLSVEEWKLDGLPQLSDAAAKYASFVQTLVQSPQWQNTVSASLGTLADFGKEVMKQREQARHARQDALDNANKAKIEATQRDIAAFHQDAARVTSPTAAPAHPGCYVLSMRVNLEDNQMGLPGLHVRITDPGDKKQPLAEGITDEDGNVVLVLEKEQADRLGREKQDVGIEVVSSNGKMVYKQEAALSPRLNRSDTLIAALKTSPDLKHNVAVATELKKGREAHLAGLQRDLEDFQSRGAQPKSTSDPTAVTRKPPKNPGKTTRPKGK